MRRFFVVGAIIVTSSLVALENADHREMVPGEIASLITGTDGGSRSIEYVDCHSFNNDSIAPCSDTDPEGTACYICEGYHPNSTGAKPSEFPSAPGFFKGSQAVNCGRRLVGECYDGICYNTGVSEGFCSNLYNYDWREQWIPTDPEDPECPGPGDGPINP